MKTKTQISFAVTANLISAFVFATRIVQSLFYLNLKFQASSHLVWLYSPVCVGPGRKPRSPVFSQRGSHFFSGSSDFKLYDASHDFGSFTNSDSFFTKIIFHPILSKVCCGLLLLLQVLKSALLEIIQANSQNFIWTTLSTST